ncbi:MAG: phytanoyl-CoA dioxygenase family protein [Candidatus Latescibacterota bacterium]|nr:phytanoyl-CoA dioxygenase family protein [Candidatus Latescibacterota bacterium]
MHLSNEDIWYCKQNGYHRIPNILPNELIERLTETTDKYVSTMEEPIIWENSESRSPQDIRRLSKILSRDPVYLEAATHPLILNALEGIIGPNIELLTNKHNHLMVRPPNSYAVPWHAGEETYDPVLFTALIYLEESTVENGCIRIVPGSHQRPVSNMKFVTNDDFYSHPLYHRALPVPMPSGGVLLFDDRLYHGADVNNSQTSRRSMTLAYRAHDAHNVIKDDPEKILVRGERIYTGHPHPYNGK